VQAQIENGLVGLGFGIAAKKRRRPSAAKPQPKRMEERWQKVGDQKMS
jgi:hypothetical protein